MPRAWPRWHSLASWGVPRSSVRCWSCPRWSSGVTVISLARRTLSMPSTRCYPTAEQVRRKANRITPVQFYENRYPRSTELCIFKWALTLSHVPELIATSQGRDVPKQWHCSAGDRFSCCFFCSYSVPLFLSFLFAFYLSVIQKLSSNLF